MRSFPSKLVHTLLTCSVVFGALAANGEDGGEFFEKRIRPVIVEQCYECHSSSAKKVKGGLRVDSREALLAGGDSGPAIVPGAPEKSLLLKAVRHEDKDLTMPPKKPKLPEAVLADLAAWVKGGAVIPVAVPASSSKPHWAFQPVQHPVPPKVKSQWPRTSVDHFILARLQEKKAQPAPVADKRTLLRRATYGLTGLPPTPEEIALFDKDRSPGAFPRVVERLLASPRYGERWGRHWLDVVRYADTAGENSDHPLPHAWRYRNWVIDAFNRDLPYDEFIRQQIAGDLMAKSGTSEQAAERIIATGYLAIARRFGHEIEKDMHLTFEDTIDTMGKSVLGLTLGCARCHNHKYDPVTTRDYYGLYGIFQSTRFAFPGCEPQQQPRDLVPIISPEVVARQKQYEAELAAIDAGIKKLNDAQSGTLKELRAVMTNHSRLLAKGEFKDGGSQDFLTNAATPMEVTVRAGELIQLSVWPRANHGADTTHVEFEIAEAGDAGRRWNVTEDVMEDFLAGNPHADRQGHAATWSFFDARKGPQFLAESLRDHDGKKGLHVWRNGDTPSAVVNASDKPIKAWTTLPPRTLFIHPAPDGPVALAWLSPFTGTVNIKGRVADAHPGGGDGVAWRLEHIGSNVASGLTHLANLAQQLRDPMKQRNDLKTREPKVPVAYAVTEGKPANARIQKRGEPADLGDEVPRKFLDVLGGQALPAGLTNSGRLELARWLTGPTNPLTARVMVNRIWQHHFGRGLVRTPNDFGIRGEAPTHPELLDYLATEFARGGWSIKAMHRLILRSATYQQMSGPAESDYAAFPSRRLTAEEIRDSLLSVSGELDLAPGEAHPFPPESTWSFTQHGPFAAEYDTRKRSVYMMTKRNKRLPFFALFDGADPNASTPVRDQTTVPTQALFFMNDPMVHGLAAKFAQRVLASSTREDQRVHYACQLLYARPAMRDDLREFENFRQDYLGEIKGESTDQQARTVWSAYARVLFAGNEFLDVN